MIKLTGPQLELLQMVAIRPIIVKYNRHTGRKTAIICCEKKVNATVFTSLWVELNLIVSEGNTRHWPNGHRRESRYRINEAGRDELAARTIPVQPSIVDPMLKKPEWLELRQSSTKDVEFYVLEFETSGHKHLIYVARASKSDFFSVRFTAYGVDMSVESSRKLAKALEFAASIVEYRSQLDEVKVD